MPAALRMHRGRVSGPAYSAAPLWLFFHQVLLVLAKVDDWQFDTFELEEASGGWPLSTLTFALFTKLRLTHSR